MTTRIYYTDAECVAFSARVVDLAEDGRRVYLDRTAFYPTSGGQPHDVGTLGDVPVVDVVDEDERVAHVLAAPLALDVGATVDGAVDAARRVDHMQQHTGQHLLSAVFADLLGAETASVHFGPALSTIELAGGTVDRDGLVAVEARANALVAADVPVAVTFEDAAAATGLRKPTGRTGEIRVVSIDGVDRSACGGTHVRSTARIGAVLLRRVERIRQNARVEFVCGLRAARRARADYDALADVAAAFSTSVDQAPATARAQAEALRDALGSVERLTKDLAALRAESLVAAAVPDARGARWIVQRVPGKVDELRALALAVAERPGGVFVALGAEPPAVLVAAAADSGVDAGAVLKEALAQVGGKGGGSLRLAQGKVPNVADLDRVAAQVRG
ncbi:Threonyl/alanyl tRNA synthetase SAD [Gemmatirosa kalamazoonensis]|uniref:Threonyl/alanyl tRNA synthetase SAD n=1 Tax=Gemmatirosa kalamazoonensis TaxID=861299 RepID=W0RCB8_9BACT|nr:DHHA1 domain-containing protein [Gemmatirosa kalamazoonensis]AHG87970.1 Threonyl/alanyl tRNA synthetase SAD [Gemmatirosa kalamazoonensis]